MFRYRAVSSGEHLTTSEGYSGFPIEFGVEFSDRNTRIYSFCPVRSFVFVLILVSVDSLFLSGGEESTIRDCWHPDKAKNRSNEHRLISLNCIAFIHYIWPVYSLPLGPVNRLQRSVGKPYVLTS